MFFEMVEPIPNKGMLLTKGDNYFLVTLEDGPPGLDVAHVYECDAYGDPEEEPLISLASPCNTAYVAAVDRLKGLIATRAAYEEIQ